MAVAILVLAIISLFAVGMAMITFQPAIYSMAYESDFWDAEINQNIPVELAVLRDTIYAITIALPMVMVGVVVIWALLATSRRDDI